jgi:signal transduction histidine kinase
MKIPGNRRYWFRLGQLGALCAMAVLGLIDVGSGSLIPDIYDGGGELVALWRVLLAIATAAVWLPAHRTGSVRLPVAAIVLAAASFFTTAAIGMLTLDASDDDLWGLAETLGLLGVAFVVARRGAARPALWGVASVGMAVAALPLRGAGVGASLVIGMFLALCAGGAAASGMYLRLAENGRQRALATVRAEQRAEFARDLHDFIAHHVTGIVVQAQGAKFIAEKDPQRAIAALEQIERAGAETMAQMRRMVGVLRDADAPPDAPLAPLGGVADLDPLLENFAATGPPAPRLHVDGSLDGLPLEVSTSAYRVVMEALTNVRRHASGAKAVDIWVRRTPDWLLVRIADDGFARVAPPRERSGYGLVGLGERVRAVGGRITAGPGIGDAGWVVDAALPLDREVAR